MNIDRRLLITSAVAAAAGADAGSASAAEPDTRSLAVKFAAALSAHDMTAFAALFADDYINHQASAAAPPPPPGVSDKQLSVRFFAARLAGIPNLTVTTEVIVSSADHVAASFVYSGTHGGTYNGVAPTGKALKFTSCDIFLVRNGQLAEHWGMGDIAGVNAQLHS